MRADSVSSGEALINKTVLVRIAPGEDVFCALREVCRKHDIRSGHIATMIGSLRSADVVCVTSHPEDPSRAVYLDPLHLEEYLELVGVQGIIGEDDKGELNIHLHVVLAGADSAPAAGHLADTGNNRIFATAEAVINGFKGAEFRRSLDKETVFVLFKVREGPREK